MNKIVTIVLISLSTITFAQEKKAEAILEKLDLHTGSYKNITINFDFIFKNHSLKLDESVDIGEVVQRGTIIIEGDKFQIDMDNQTIINDGENQWMHLKEMNEVQIIENNPEVLSPNTLFNFYKENYKYKYISCIEDIHIIDLFPKKRKDIIKTTIKIDSRKNQLREIVIHDKNGETQTYILKSIKKDTLIKPFIFNINDFPNIEVIDLR